MLLLTLVNFITGCTNNMTLIRTFTSLKNKSMHTNKNVIDYKKLFFPANCNELRNEERALFKDINSSYFIFE